MFIPRPLDAAWDSTQPPHHLDEVKLDNFCLLTSNV